MSDHDRHNHSAPAAVEEKPAGHAHDDHDHRRDMRELSRRRLWWALVINLVFLVVEIAGGLITNSLALLADAGHMLTDVAALGLAIFMAHLASLPFSPKRTYGFIRAEVLGAFANGASLVVVVGFIFIEAWRRWGHPLPVNGPLMLIVAVAGLLANLASAWILAGGREDNLNVRGAFLHMVADALGSAGAIIAGIVIWTTGWIPIDPLVSVVIGLLILWSGAGLIRQTIHILMEGTPESVDYDEVKRALSEMPHVQAVSDLHIWTITSGVPVLSARLSLAACCSDTTHWQECLKNAQEMLETRFGIHHSTIQVEPAADQKECQLK